MHDDGENVTALIPMYLPPASDADCVSILLYQLLSGEGSLCMAFFFMLSRYSCCDTAKTDANISSSSQSVRPGAQGDGGLDSARAAPAGEGGLAGVSECEGSGISGEGAELRCRGDRAFHSSKPLEAAAVAELHVALALRGCRACFSWSRSHCKYDSLATCSSMASLVASQSVALFLSSSICCSIQDSSDVVMAFFMSDWSANCVETDTEEG